MTVVQVYGPGDENGLVPRAVCAAAYTVLGTKMEFLWGAEMRLNTVGSRCFHLWLSLALPGSTWLYLHLVLAG